MDFSNNKCMAGYVPKELTAEDEAEIAGMIDRQQKVDAAITEATKDKRGNISGTIECPVCQGTVTYSIASNGHMRACCSTEGCADWME